MKNFDVKIEVTAKVYPREMPMNSVEGMFWKNMSNKADVEAKQLCFSLESYIEAKLMPHVIDNEKIL